MDSSPPQSPFFAKTAISALADLSSKDYTAPLRGVQPKHHVPIWSSPALDAPEAGVDSGGDGREGRNRPQLYLGHGTR